ncbi:unnamed protein product [Dicrocoelium dendriticum]|nr:unnamed protein product [Dicrocoelium dendriticum]
METTEEFFRQIHQQRLQHPGYSPCPFYRRMENHLQGAFLMPISPSLSTPNTGTFSTMASGQLLKNHFTKDCIREVKPAVNSAVYNGPSIKQNPSSEYSRVTATAPSNFPLNLTCLHRESDRDLNKKKYYTNILENKVAENEAGICESSLETSSEICLPSMPRNFENFNTDSLQIYNPCYDKRDESGASHLNYCKQLLLNDAAISQYCGAVRRTSNKKLSPASLSPPTRTNESSKCIHNVRHVPVSPKPLTVECGISERTDINPSNIEHLKICNDSNAQYTNNATKEKKASKLRTAMSSQRIVSENNELRKMDCKDAVKFDLLHSEKEKVPMLQQRMQKTAFSQTIHRPAGIIEGVLLHAHPVESLKHAASKEINQKLENTRLLSVVSQNDNHKASGNGMDT